VLPRGGEAVGPILADGRKIVGGMVSGVEAHADMSAPFRSGEFEEGAAGGDSLDAASRSEKKPSHHAPHSGRDLATGKREYGTRLSRTTDEAGIARSQDIGVLAKIL